MVAHGLHKDCAGLNLVARRMVTSKLFALLVEGCTRVAQRLCKGYMELHKGSQDCKYFILRLYQRCLSTLYGLHKGCRKVARDCTRFHQGCTAIPNSIVRKVAQCLYGVVQVLHMVAQRFSWLHIFAKVYTKVAQHCANPTVLYGVA